MRSPRVLGFVAVAAAAVALGAGYLAYSVRQAEPAPPAAGPGLAGAPVEAPFLVYQRVERDENYARIAVARITPTGVGREHITGLKCERVYFSAGRGLCLQQVHALRQAYDAVIFGPDFRERATIRALGINTRARVSPDGRYGATTGFVSGHSYADDTFSTHTVLLDLAKGEEITDLEQFDVYRDGEKFSKEDFNYWGVTFARDSDRFFATLATGGKTYLVEGSVRKRRLDVRRENVECPSLSPDGTRIAYKRALGDNEGWRLHVLDLRTGADVALAEEHSIDDQVEWLDDERVLYGNVAQLWVVPADGTGTPRVFVKDALSPASVHG